MDAHLSHTCIYRDVCGKGQLISSAIAQLFRLPELIVDDNQGASKRPLEFSHSVTVAMWGAAFLSYAGGHDRRKVYS